MECVLCENSINDFEKRLILEEKSGLTVLKYVLDVRIFISFIGSVELNKEIIMNYKNYLSGKYSIRSVNSKIASINSFLHFLGKDEFCVKYMKLQRQVYMPEDKQLTKDEYIRVVSAASKLPRLRLIIEALCATGIRVSELKYFTVESVNSGTVTVTCKNKTRNIIIPGKLRKKLLEYARKMRINSGIIFRTKSGLPINRSNIWSGIKKLSTASGVNADKLFPHNFRKLFARIFYGIDKDIAKLADVLGHSSIETTRIYIMTTVSEHRRIIEHMNLIM